MSHDSSSTPTAALAQKIKSFLQWPKKDWGIVAGALVGLAALYAPLYILGPFFSAFIAPLAVTIDLKLSLAQAAVAVVSLLIIGGGLALYNKKFSDLHVKDYPTLAYLGKAALGFFVYFAATFAIALAYHYLFNQPDQAQDIGYSKGLGGFDLIFAGITLVFLVPIKEEIIFRGFMLKGFRNRLPFWVAALGVSAIFGLVHGQLNVGLDVFAMSMVSCYLVEKTGSLWPSIFLHMIKNGVAFYLLYLYNGG